MLPPGYKAPWNHPSHSDALPLDPVTVARRAAAVNGMSGGSGAPTVQKSGLAGAIASIASSSSSSAKPPTTERSVAASKAESLLAKNSQRPAGAAAAATGHAWLRLSKVPDPRVALGLTEHKGKTSPYTRGVPSLNKPSSSSASATVRPPSASRRSKVLAGAGGHLPGSAKPQVPANGRWGGGPATTPKSRPWCRKKGSGSGGSGASSEAKAVVATLSRLKNFSEAQWSEARESFIKTHEEAEVAAAVAAEFDRERLGCTS
jgi:hypothetical protein